MQQLLLVLAMLADKPISPDDAIKFMGKDKVVTVRMKVEGATWLGADPDVGGRLSPKGGGKGLVVNVSRTATGRRLTGEEERPMIEAYKGKTIEVTGKIVPLDKDRPYPRLHVERISQIKIVETGE